jgi:ribonuclease P/MRP protein subunit POP5
MYLSAMFFMKQIGPIPCSFRILHVSGTIIHIQKEAIERDRRCYLKEKERLLNEEGKTVSMIEKMEASTKQIQALSAD